MDSVLYYRAMEAFSRQRAKMDGESEIFWLAEAEVLSKLGADAHKLKMLLDPKMQKEPRERKDDDHEHHRDGQDARQSDARQARDARLDKECDRGAKHEGAEEIAQ